jgi:hypothetical protein
VGGAGAGAGAGAAAGACDSVGGDTPTGSEAEESGGSSDSESSPCDGSEEAPASALAALSEAANLLEVGGGQLVQHQPPQHTAAGSAPAGKRPRCALLDEFLARAVAKKAARAPPPAAAAPPSAAGAGIAHPPKKPAGRPATFVLRGDAPELLTAEVLRPAAPAVRTCNSQILTHTRHTRAHYTHGVGAARGARPHTAGVRTTY